MAKPLAKFDATHARSEQLIALYHSLAKGSLTVSGEAVTIPNVSDLLRSSIVLSVSAMDAYFTDKFVDVLIPYLRRRGPTDGIIELLQKAGLDTRQALEMLTMKRPYRRVRTLLDAHLETFTTQRAPVIDSLFVVFGLKEFTKHVMGLAERQNLIARVDAVVERRHQIVHEGDLSPRGKLQKIDAAAVQRQIKDVALCVRTAEQLCCKIK